MSITETPAPVPQKKRRRARRKRTVPAPKKPVAYLAGITATACPAACTPAGCIISGRPRCAHPYKGGLQGRELSDDGAVKRLDDAKKALGKAKIKIGKLNE